MSNSSNINTRKRTKIKKAQNSIKDIGPIDPDLLTYIQKIQNDNDKAKIINYSKNQMPMQVERILTNKLININDSSALNEDMTFDKDKRFAAKKGLLYLLNNLSNGTFCPDIEEYFSKMKESKKEELKHKSRMQEYGKVISEEELENNKEKKMNFKKFKKEPVISSNIDEKVKNIKVGEGKTRDGKNIEINEKYGLKKYHKDYDAEDLINLYDKNELKDNTFQIKYNKEKAIKLKLKKENQNNNF